MFCSVINVFCSCKHKLAMSLDSGSLLRSIWENRHWNVLVNDLLFGLLLYQIQALFSLPLSLVSYDCDCKTSFGCFKDLNYVIGFISELCLNTCWSFIWTALFWDSCVTLRIVQAKQVWLLVLNHYEVLLLWLSYAMFLVNAVDFMSCVSLSFFWHPVIYCLYYFSTT